MAYEAELANGQIENASEILSNCLLTLNDHTFRVNLIPMPIGSFDIIIGTYWLSSHHAKIMCYEKVVRITLLDGKTLTIYVDKPSQNLKLMSCTKARKNLHMKYYYFLAYVVIRRVK